jgi:alpha-galactosidase
MSKIVIIGAGSIVFTKNLLGDLLTFDDINIDTISLVDLDLDRLIIMKKLAIRMCEQLENNIKIEATTNRKDCLKGAKYVVCTIGVGGISDYETDIFIPDKYGINQNVGDTIGPGGVFRGIRVIPEILGICKDMEKLCPDAILFQYSNPMAAICRAVSLSSKIKFIGLCHSVQDTAAQIASYLGSKEDLLTYWCAGINHMSWFLKLEINGVDAYPSLRKLASSKESIYKLYESENVYSEQNIKLIDIVRFEILKHFGYFVTESPFHMSEYVPYFRKNKKQISELEVQNRWWLDHVYGAEQYYIKIKEVLDNHEIIEIEKSREYAPDIIRSIETNKIFRANLNVENTGLITNLPYGCSVEVPCLIDSTGIHPCFVGDLPEQCVSLNRTNINVQELMVKAVLERKREYILQAIKLDPLTSSILTLDEINKMVEEMFRKQDRYLKDYN